MRNLLLDVIKHTHGLGLFENIKVTGSDKATTFDGMSKDKAVIIAAKANDAEDELAGEYGMSRLQILQGYLNFTNYKTDDATITVSRSTRDGKEGVPTEITFDDGKGQKSAYRFMDAKHVQCAQFKGADWDVSVKPTNSKIKEFQELAGILSSAEPFFLAHTEDGNLKFTIGDESADRATITIADNVDGKLSGDLYWPCGPVISILKLGTTEKPTIDITHKGALQITLVSEFGEYKYILPARRR